MKKLKRIFIMLLIVFVLIIIFDTKYTSLKRDFEKEVQKKESQINYYAETCNTTIELMTIYGNDFFLQDESEDSKFYPYLKYNAKLDSFNLDAIDESSYLDEVGNITGFGPLPDKGRKRDEINLGFQYFSLFDSIHKVIPNAAWMYYLSNKNFISLYPWVSSEEFKYSDRLKKEMFFTEMTPPNNPLRKSLWVPLYIDHGGKGLMITLSSPIYNKNTFMGVVCIDLTNEHLSNIMNSKYEGYLIDHKDNIIASSQDKHPIMDILNINEKLCFTQSELEQLKDIRYGEVRQMGNYFVYQVKYQEAPWDMIYLVPKWTFISQSILFTAPTLLICILLVFVVIQSEYRKRNGILLTTSLNDLKSYQELLENAAKYDSLTTAYNRRGLQERFSNYKSEIKDLSIPISFLLGDIDHFKLFNDTYGHSAGDKVLIELTKLMKQKVSDMDVVCRWGGEEFTIMLYDRTYDESMVLAEEIRKGIESLLIHWEDVQIKVTMTFGVVEYNHEEILEDCISKADQALYFGKENGRNRVVGYLDTIE